VPGIGRRRVSVCATRLPGGLGVLMMGFNYIWIYRAEQLITSGLVAVLFPTLVSASPVAMRLALPLRVRRLSQQRLA
jgi:hypothetical protein